MPFVLSPSFTHRMRTNLTCEKLPLALEGGFPGSSAVRNLPSMQEIRVRSLDREDSLEKEMATHSSILVRRIPQTEEPWGYSLHRT